jgi:hypothetical protein
VLLAKRPLMGSVRITHSMLSPRDGTTILKHSLVDDTGSPRVKPNLLYVGAEVVPSRVICMAYLSPPLDNWQTHRNYEFCELLEVTYGRRSSALLDHDFRLINSLQQDL